MAILKHLPFVEGMKSEEKRAKVKAALKALRSVSVTDELDENGATISRKVTLADVADFLLADAAAAYRADRIAEEVKQIPSSLTEDERKAQVKAIEDGEYPLPDKVVQYVESQVRQVVTAIVANRRGHDKPLLSAALLALRLGCGMDGAAIETNGRIVLTKGLPGEAKVIKSIAKDSPLLHAIPLEEEYGALRKGDVINHVEEDYTLPSGEVVDLYLAGRRGQMPIAYFLKELGGECEEKFQAALALWRLDRGGRGRQAKPIDDSDAGDTGADLL